MSDIAIKVETLSKRYRIGVIEEAPDTFVGAVSDIITRPIKNFRRLWRLSAFSKNGHEEQDIIWALRDVSFEVKRGEAVGIIGRNGAGKSTLLKILTRITDPTSGRAIIRGRAGALLEVGTGFHPELTGRENIYLNGTILGMRKKELDRKFDEIVDFSGVEKFIDTPVKRYSSGMKVRLAFAVAAHLEPEILIIDEVLAVGDAEFQRKCLGKMDDATRGGRTVLFVSHNMGAVQSLCTRAIYLRDGEIVQDAPVAQTMTTYLNSVQQQIDNLPLPDRRDRVGGDKLRITDVEFLDAQTGCRQHTLLSGQDVLIRVHFECRGQQPVENVCFGIGFFVTGGAHLFSCSSEAVGHQFRADPGAGACTCRIPKWPLRPGRYTFNVIATSNHLDLDWVKEAGVVEVEKGNYYGSGKLPGGSKSGVLIDYQW